MIVVLREGRILVLGYCTAARGGAGRVGRAGGADADSLSLLGGALVPMGVLDMHEAGCFWNESDGIFFPPREAQNVSRDVDIKIRYARWGKIPSSPVHLQREK